MATKAKYARISDIYAGNTLWVVWLGDRELHPTRIRVAGKPFTDEIATWFKTFSQFGNGFDKDSLSTLGIPDANGCVGGWGGRHTFTTYRAAMGFCKKTQGSQMQADYIAELNEMNESFDRWGDHDYDEPTEEEDMAFLERTLGEDLRTFFKDGYIGLPEKLHFHRGHTNKEFYEHDWPIFLYPIFEGSREFRIGRKISTIQLRIDGRYHIENGFISTEPEYYTFYKGVWYDGWDHDFSNGTNKKPNLNVLTKPSDLNFDLGYYLGFDAHTRESIKNREETNAEIERLQETNN